MTISCAFEQFYLCFIDCGMAIEQEDTASCKKGKSETLPFDYEICDDIGRTFC